MLNREDDPKKSVLAMCTCCANVYHPKCAGLCATVRRMQENWACPECVFIAESELKMVPLHRTPGVMNANDPANSRNLAVDAVVSTDDDDVTAKEPEAYHKLPWLRWKMGQQRDFQAEANVLQQLANDRGYVVWFLPKFHCEINWAELYWCNAKTFVRGKVDGKLGTMHKALWLSYGRVNTPLVLMRRFARKVREIIHMYRYEVDGTFAVYCQKMFNKHRLSFINANALKPWAVGSHATCVKKEFVGVGKNKKRGTKMVMCTIVRINEEEKTCALQFGSSQLGFKRYDVPLSELRPIPEGSTSYAT